MPDSIILLILIFCCSLALLVFSADKFIEYAEKIGLALGIPAFVIGVTVVSLGTSLPELVSSIIAIYDGEPGIVTGNVIGSNITNILLVLGAVGLIARQFTIHFNFKKIDLPFFILASLYVWLTCIDQNFTFIEGLIGIVLIISYVYVSVKVGKIGHETIERPQFKWIYVLLLILGALGIFLGAKYNVKSVILIGNKINIDPSVIALTAVALGTSLPELFVSVAAIRKNNAEIAVGNVLGSNIFNSFAILGIPRMFGELEITKTINNVSIPIMLLATVLFIVFTWNKKVSWLVGLILLLCYILFLYFSFNF